MNKEEIKQQVIDSVASTMGVDAKSLSEKTKMKEDLLADSIDAVDIIVDLESRFEVEFADLDVNKVNFETIGDICEFVENQINK